MTNTAPSDYEIMVKSMGIDYRSRESFSHAVAIHKPFGGLESVLAWCKSELVDTWRWQMVEISTDHRPGRYIFYFDSEKECMAFSLKWC